MLGVQNVDIFQNFHARLASACVRVFFRVGLVAHRKTSIFLVKPRVTVGGGVKGIFTNPGERTAAPASDLILVQRCEFFSLRFSTARSPRPKRYIAAPQPHLNGCWFLRQSAPPTSNVNLIPHADVGEPLTALRHGN